MAKPDKKTPFNKQSKTDLAKTIFNEYGNLDSDLLAELHTSTLTCEEVARLGLKTVFMKAMASGSYVASAQMKGKEIGLLTTKATNLEKEIGRLEKVKLDLEKEVQDGSSVIGALKLDINNFAQAKKDYKTNLIQKFNEFTYAKKDAMQKKELLPDGTDAKTLCNELIISPFKYGFLVGNGEHKMLGNGDLKDLLKSITSVDQGSLTNGTDQIKIVNKDKDTDQDNKKANDLLVAFYEACNTSTAQEWNNLLDGDVGSALVAVIGAMNYNAEAFSAAIDGIIV